MAVGLTAVAAVAFFWALDMNAFAIWAAEQQRTFQNAMAAGVRGLRTGQSGAWFALLSAAGAYGFVHAVGPGHGKYVIGGVGLGSSVSAVRLAGIALASSLGQSIWAIIIVYGSFSLLTFSAHQLTAFAEDILAPVSYLAVGLVGLLLAWRGMRKVWPALKPKPASNGGCASSNACGCGHKHAPAAEEVALLTSWRETLLLIGSVAIRPCTGAIFLLIIAWQMDIKLAGVAAAIIMGLGTAGLTTLVAVSSVAARGLAVASANGLGAMVTAVSALQAVSGVMIMWISFLLFGAAVRA
ncbi:MAG: hypothetical protein AAF460_14795 [Pseudomonadota bacterium]